MFESATRQLLTCLGLRQHGIEKSWQIPLEIDPARMAHADDAVWAETGLCGSHGRSDENITWMRALFAAGMSAVHRRAHAVFLLHFAGLSFHGFHAYANLIRAQGGRVPDSPAQQKLQCILASVVEDSNMPLRIGSSRSASLIMPL